MSKISKVIARQVFDSRGNPTIETEVFVKTSASIVGLPLLSKTCRAFTFVILLTYF